MLFASGMNVHGFSWVNEGRKNLDGKLDLDLETSRGSD